MGGLFGGPSPDQQAATAGFPQQPGYGQPMPPAPFDMAKVMRDLQIQQAANGLTTLGTTLTAAGQPQTGAQRAQVYQRGNESFQRATDPLQAFQSALMQGQLSSLPLQQRLLGAQADVATQEAGQMGQWNDYMKSLGGGTVSPAGPSWLGNAVSMAQGTPQADASVAAPQQAPASLPAGVSPDILRMLGPKAGPAFLGSLATKSADEAAALRKAEGEKKLSLQYDPQISAAKLAAETPGMAARAGAEANAKLSSEKELAKYKNDLQYMIPGMPGSSGGEGPSLHGEDFLKTIPEGTGTLIKKLANGELQFPSGFALKTPYWQNMLTMTGQYDPSFDAINYNNRSATRKAFTSGQPATQINAMNTVIGHLQSLSDAADKLNNTSYPGLNAVQNWMATQTGDPRIKQFDTTKKAVVDELTRVWRGSGGSEQDIKTWSEQINAANSPDQLHGVIAQVGDLLESKIGAMGEQYKQGMGTSAEPLRLLTPQARKSLDVLEKRAGKQSTSSEPVKISGDAEYEKLPSGARFIGPDGQLRIKP